MLSLAYGSDQRGSLQAHKPEVCYPAQGFRLQRTKPVSLPRHLATFRCGVRQPGSRQEPVTYWFTVGDQAAMGTTQKKLVELRLGLTGRIPDGMLFRISSMDPDRTRAYQAQEKFVNQLLESARLRTPASERAGRRVVSGNW